jgi:hypothetical protein
MEWKDVWNFILALLGIGGVTYLATGAWTIPQAGVYASLVTDTTWYHINTAAPCIWEVHPNTTKTINSVSYGSPGSWTTCTQNSSDWLLWTCSGVTANGSSQICPQIRVVQNEFPGTTETMFNGTLVTRNITAIPGCEGSRDCTIVGSKTAGNVTHMSITIPVGTTLTISTGSTVRAYSINNNGGIILAAGGTVTFSGVDNITNNGTITGAASNIVFTDVRYFGNSITGTVSVAGVSGTKGGACTCCAKGTGLHCASVCASAGTNGGTGGTIKSTNASMVFNNTGTIILSGGAGGSGGDSSPACDTCPLLYPYIWECTPPGTGGLAGYINASTFQFINTGTITATGGSGGVAGSCYGACTAGVPGNGNNNTINVVNTTNITNSMTATGTVNGQWAINTCANASGNNYALVSPTPTVSNYTCRSLPATPGLNVSSGTYTALLQNISTNFTGTTAADWWWSPNNGTTWYRYTPSENTTDPPSYAVLSYNLSTHRLANSTQQLVRVREYNATTGLYSAFNTSSAFNLTLISSNITRTSDPSGTVSSNAVTFYCNYTNSSGAAIEAATAKLMLDGTLYNMSYNNTTKVYYYLNNNTWEAGTHNYSCINTKADYAAANNSSTSVSLIGFGIFLPTGQTSVRLSCPFPTIPGMTPAGQKAGIGIFRIVNYNTTALRNYTLYLNNTLPNGIIMYGRCDRYSPNIANWTTLSTTTGYKGLVNINSTNTTAYCWLRMDCVSATAGTYAPFDYIFVEE